MMRSQRAGKRVLEDDDDLDKVYRFKVLLPNGASVGLTLRAPQNEMPMEEFVKLVRDAYHETRVQCGFMRKRRQIDWKGGQFSLEDAHGNKMTTEVNFGLFMPFKCHILQLHDGSGEIMDTFENMWDLTPDTDLLKELPEDYTFETALADLIDNSLQAVWSNGKNDRRLISVEILEDKISIFDSGIGMDGSEKNSIAKWGKIGASLHRSSKPAAVGGKPPYLMPFFGMFGYGGPIASMHLGGRAVVSSKTKESRKVYTLHLEREVLLNRSVSAAKWKTDGGMRDPSEEEMGLSPHGSFTKVEIFEPKLKSVNLSQLKCKMKDIYFPYIQCDEVSKTGRTERPIEFQVNGVDLAEFEGGEVAITNLNTCNGREFAFQLRLTHRSDTHDSKSQGGAREANARLKFVYFPIVKGKENIERILENLEAQGCRVPENYETFCRVSVRRLGRLLPEVRWAWLPFMDIRKGQRATALRRCRSRVKCFIDTDAGFNPTPSKTDLALKNPFTMALKSFGSKTVEKEQDVSIEIHRSGKVLSFDQLEKGYQDWILEMHESYDEEVDSGEDQPVIIVGLPNKKAFGVSSDVVRVHKRLKKNAETWKRGQKIKILKGACAGCHSNNIYATLEYFLIEGFPGDAGGDARIICRPLGQPDEEGCVLSIKDGNPSLDIGKSLSLPIGIIDSGKCIAVESNEWESKLATKHRKAPSKIDLLNEKHCQELDIDGVLPLDSPIPAGQVPPSDIVAVLRPASFTSSTPSKNLEQKNIVKNGPEIHMEIKLVDDADKSEKPQHIYSARLTPSTRKGFHGLYVFPLRSKCPDLFKKAGIYKFSFSVEKTMNCMEKVIVEPSPEIGSWKLLSDPEYPSYSVRLGSSFPTCQIACYDIYDNRIPFTAIPNLAVQLSAKKGFCVHIDNMNGSLIHEKWVLQIEDILIQTSKLDKIRPSYEAILHISQTDKQISVSIPCKVEPGTLHHVVARSPMMEYVLPDIVVEHLTLEMFDEFGNHVEEDSVVELKVDGFHIQDRIGLKRKVDDRGFVDLSGVLKVTAGYGRSVSLCVLSDDQEIFKQEYQTEKRELRVTSELPASCPAGSHLENLTLAVTDLRGAIDERIHDDETSGHFHTITIKSETFNMENVIRYTFKHGRCTIPSIDLPNIDGIFCFEAFHSRHVELRVTVKISLLLPPKMESNETCSPCSSNKILPLEDGDSVIHRSNMIYLQKLENDIARKLHKYGSRVGLSEEQLKVLEDQKAEIQQSLEKLQASLKPSVAKLPDFLSTKEEMMRQIEENQGNSAASVLCSLLNKYPLQGEVRQSMKDVIGLVALLGTVGSATLSRMLAEYLGEERMLAIVCTYFEAARALERYKQNGEIDRTRGLHAEAAALGKSIDSRFLVICLEGVRAYTGEFVKKDPQRKLALPAPTSPNGRTVPGFMGYAVNMISLDSEQLNIRTAGGHGLRETLFYSLFEDLQIYDTRKNLEKALPYTKRNAVSLDGAIVKENGCIISLGDRKPEVYFPITISGLSSESKGIALQIRAKKEELGGVEKKIEMVTQAHGKARAKFNKIKDKYNSFMMKMKPLLHLHATIQTEDECQTPISLSSHSVVS